MIADLDRKTYQSTEGVTQTCVADVSEVNDQPEPDRGISCRQCGCRHFYTLETRKTLKGRIRRRRRCRHCGLCVTTYERIFEE